MGIKKRTIHKHTVSLMSKLAEVYYTKRTRYIFYKIAELTLYISEIYIVIGNLGDMIANELIYCTTI
jgi:hypothetical protein